MTKRTIGTLFSAIAISAIVGCGSSSATAKSAWNGVFVDTGVQGLTWVCGTASGTTLVDGGFGECPAGTSATFSIGTVSLGTIAETSDHIFTPQDLVGASRTAANNSSDQNDKVNAIAAALLTLDSDGDSSNGITIVSSGVSAFETAIAANGDAITVANIASITAAVVSAVPTLTNVSVATASTHLATVAAEIIAGTISEPTQPSALSGTSGSTGS